MQVLSEPFLTKSLVYDRCGFLFENPAAEKESTEYDAFTFDLNGSKVLFRSAKITPKKTGQFVTLWKRLGDGPIMPYDATDAIDLVIISVRSDNHYGQFIFPKSILLKKGIFTTACKDGKRAIRVYPFWDITENVQAKKTQKWQLDYFVDLSKSLNEDKIKSLYKV
ncbi:hypothetical protein AMR72_01885 [Flavobacterium psychrophilum]|nr:hypothetical protein AMR72_01885 [Flavobacterium psychrophilum]AOE51383.1 hypothetical protein ALW18_01885 [Flavobacterium psychrophilum]